MLQTTDRQTELRRQIPERNIFTHIGGVAEYSSILSRNLALFSVVIVTVHYRVDVFVLFYLYISFYHFFRHSTRVSQSINMRLFQT